jgi:hypothetical protein
MVDTFDHRAYFGNCGPQLYALCGHLSHFLGQCGCFLGNVDVSVPQKFQCDVSFSRW